MYISPRDKGGARLVEESFFCEKCHFEKLELFIVPPTFFKALDGLHLRNVWNNAERAMREAPQWIFCGYSLPDADIYFKYIAKKALLSSPDKEIIIANHHDGKDRSAAEREYFNYLSCFGPDVKFTNLSFDDVAGNLTSLESIGKYYSIVAGHDFDGQYSDRF